jgi:hypothetical protein
LKAIPAVVSLDSDVESTASKGTDDSKSTKVPAPVVKQLLFDIEHAGGIQKFDRGIKQATKILLDNGDPVIYGFRGDSLRRTLTNKVYKWKKEPREKYLARLLRFDVRSAESLPKEAIVKLVAREPKKRRPRPPIINEEEAADIPDEIDLRGQPLRDIWTHEDKVRQQTSANYDANNANNYANVEEQIHKTSNMSSERAPDKGNGA